jgi:hypothetical protein
VQSAAEKGVLYMGTQSVLRTSDGGLHWTQISPDLTGATNAAGVAPTQGPPTVENAKERGYGVVFSIASSPLQASVIWAGSDTGLLHLTRDGGKNWQNVTPPNLTDWSKISSVEASRFDAAVAYVAVDRHRLDDDAPHLFRTRDYGKTWQTITEGIGPHAFLNAVRQDPQKRNLLYAATELGVYVSFDEGDHWQPLQLNLPTTSVRDATVHGDDLVIATHGRGFWILDDITPLRQLSSNSRNETPLFFAPEDAIRIDNDLFLGTPLPPEEPTAKNPPDGAILDYVLGSSAKNVSLDIFDTNGKLVRHVSSDQKAPTYPPLPIAQRWLPKPSMLETSPGMHRYIWDMRWGSSGTEGAIDDEDGWGAPRPPRIAPGDYTLKLTIDGKSFTQPLKVTMDPRSPATPQILAQQQELGLQIYGEAMQARKALAGMNAIAEKLTQLKPKVQSSHPELMSQITAVEAAIKGIKSGTSGPKGTISGLAAASAALASALRAVESGDRTAPSQALEVYQLADGAAKASLGDWQKLQNGAIAQLSRSLQSQGLPGLSSR